MSNTGGRALVGGAWLEYTIQKKKEKASESTPHVLHPDGYVTAYERSIAPIGFFGPVPKSQASQDFGQCVTSGLVGLPVGGLSTFHPYPSVHSRPHRFVPGVAYDQGLICPSQVY